MDAPDALNESPQAGHDAGPEVWRRIATPLPSPAWPWAAGLAMVWLRKAPEWAQECARRHGEMLPPALRGAAPARRYEYVLGRLAAGRALARLGGVSCEVGRQGRRPQWPAGWCGSIAHSDSLVAVAVMRQAHPGQSVGLDVEPLPEKKLVDQALVVETNAALAPCFSAQERQLLDALPHGRLLGFTLKEALYKCLQPLFPVEGDSLDFRDAVVTQADWACGAAVLRLMRPSERAVVQGGMVEARFGVAHGHLCACVRLA